MTILSRRGLLTLLGSVSALSVLPGCVTTHQATTTTIVINVARIKAFITAGLSAVTIVKNVVLLIPGLTLYAQIIDVAATALQKSADTFAAVAGDSVTLSYDNKDVRTAVASVKADMDKIYQIIVGVVTQITKLGEGVPSGTLDKINLVHDALLSIINIFSALIGMGLVPTENATVAFNTSILDKTLTPMSEHQALRVLQA